MKIKKERKPRISHKSNIQTLFDKVLEREYYDKLKNIHGVRRSISYHVQRINEDLLIAFEFVKRIENRKRNLSSDELFLELPDTFHLLFRHNSLNPNLSGVDQLKVMYDRLYKLCETLNYSPVDLSEYYEYRDKMLDRLGRSGD